jgi:hypothetical protein
MGVVLALPFWFILLSSPFILRDLGIVRVRNQHAGPSRVWAYHFLILQKILSLNLNHFCSIKIYALEMLL